MAGKRKVIIKSEFLKIEDINTIGETFTGIVFVLAKWREPALDNVKDESSINWAEYWNPKLEISNVKGEAKREIWCTLSRDANGQAWVTENRRAKGCFTERMELQEFPFDVQDLSLLITSELTEDEIELQENKSEMSDVCTHNFVEEGEWDLRKMVYSEHRVTQDQHAQDKHRKPGLFFRCCVIRRSTFFIWNILLIMAMISSLSMVTFELDRKLAANRIQLSFILMLAGVTFKFSASSNVPKISYLTHLDRYILGSMGFLFLVAMWHGVVARLGPEDSETPDFYMFIVCMAIFLIFQLTFFLTVLIKGWTKRREIRRLEKQYLADLAASHMGKSKPVYAASAV